MCTNRSILVSVNADKVKHSNNLAPIPEEFKKCHTSNLASMFNNNEFSGIVSIQESRDAKDNKKNRP